MLSFSQRDNRWSNTLINGANVTIGRFGCTLTCIADLSTYFGDNLTPAQTNEKCKFTSDGRIYWSSVNFRTFRFVQRTYGRDNRAILDALRDPNAAAILQVAAQSHWVVATGWQPEIKDFKIADPWLGDWSNMARYKKDITGAAFFQRK